MRKRSGVRHPARTRDTPAYARADGRVASPRPRDMIVATWRAADRCPAFRDRTEATEVTMNVRSILMLSLLGLVVGILSVVGAIRAGVETGVWTAITIFYGA